MEKQPWSNLLYELKNPAQFAQENWMWIIAFVVLLFILSRINNYMEINGVNRAIFITRGIVSSIMAFFIAPLAVVLLINIYAYINGYPFISLWYIKEWLVLTFTSYYWLLKASFGVNRDMATIYSVSSLIRIFGILIPILFVWFRVSNGRLWRLLIIPFTIGIFYITRFQEAPSTFLDKYIENIGVFDNYTKKKSKVIEDIGTVQPIPSAEFDDTGEFTPNDSIPLPGKEVTPRAKTSTTTKTANNQELFYLKYSRWIIIGLFGILLLALAAGYLFKQRSLLILLFGLAIGGFIFMYPILTSHTVKHYDPDKPVPPGNDHNQIYSLLDEFEYLYDSLQGEPSIELTKLSIVINQKINEENMRPPKRVCEHYHEYFFDLCE